MCRKGITLKQRSFTVTMQNEKKNLSCLPVGQVSADFFHLFKDKIREALWIQGERLGTSCQHSMPDSNTNASIKTPTPVKAYSVEALILMERYLITAPRALMWRALIKESSLAITLWNEIFPFFWNSKWQFVRICGGFLDLQKKCDSRHVF